MTTTPFAFTPTTGLRDSTAYPTNPGSEAAARVQVQTGMDQLRDYVNGQLQTDLAATYAAKPPTLATWIAPTLLNSWVNSGLGFEPAGYYKDDLNVVHIKGLIKSGTTTGTPSIFTLPIGYRPLAIIDFITLSYNGTTYNITEVQIAPDGSVKISNAFNTFLALGNINFRAEQ